MKAHMTTLPGQAHGLPKYKKILLLICDQFRFPKHWTQLMDENGQLSAEYFPNYARLRDKGLAFNNCYIASAACNASRACIYTGKYGKETGVTSTSGLGNEAKYPQLPNVGANSAAWFGYHPDDPECSLPTDEIIKTLGTHFKAHDFRTPYRGKWHLSEVEGHWPDKPYAVDGLSKFGFEGWRPPEGHGNTGLRMGMGADISYVQDAVNTLYELKDTHYKWFMPVNLINPHDVGFYYRWPLQIPDFGLNAPENFETTDELIENNKPWAQIVSKWYWNYVTFNKAKPDVEPKDWKDYANFYAYLAQIADFNIGILLDTIEATGQAEDTLVVFLSDHGEMGGAHGMTQKWYQAYEETIHVPLIFSNPQLPTVGKSTDSLASLIDIAPTLLSLAGIRLPEGEDNNDRLRGYDLSPVLANHEKEVQDAVLFVTDDDIVGSVFGDIDKKAAIKGAIKDAIAQKIPQGSKWKGERPSERKFREDMYKKLLNTDFGRVRVKDILDAPRFVRAIVTNDGWKLVRYVDKPIRIAEKTTTVYELYDLGSDPEEMNNLATDENLASNKAHATKFNELKAKMNALLDEKYYRPSLRCDCAEKVLPNL